jgi:uncharacterized protein
MNDRFLVQIGKISLIFSCLFGLLGCDGGERKISQIASNDPPKPESIVIDNSQIKQILANAIEQTKITRSYDPAYVRLKYPGGDVPMETGVCTDVVIRGWRSIGIDFQKEIHEDMSRNFAAYPKMWGLTKPDRNIDHRRVPNIMKWLERQGKSIQIDRNSNSYLPGDIVTWDLKGGQQHIGIVTNIRATPDRFAIVHNIADGAKVEDILFNWQIIGHYRYFK